MTDIEKAAHAQRYALRGGQWISTPAGTYNTSCHCPVCTQIRFCIGARR